MDKIYLKEGGLYVCGERCDSADEAYQLYRKICYKELGGNYNRRFNYDGKRVERIHGWGFDFADSSYVESLKKEFADYDKQTGYLLGIIGISYSYIIHIVNGVDDGSPEYDRWLDWLLCRETGAVVIRGRKNGMGRTNTKYIKNYGKRKR